jgi:ribosomal protein L20A (L18A)
MRTKRFDQFGETIVNDTDRDWERITVSHDVRALRRRAVIERVLIAIAIIASATVATVVAVVLGQWLAA